GAGGGKGPAPPDRGVPQGARGRSRRGRRAGPPGGRPARAAAVGSRTGGGRCALRVRERRSAAPGLPARAARHALGLSRPVLRPARSRLMRSKIHPAFVVAGAVFVVLLCAAAVRATPSILIVPPDRDFAC